MIGRHRSTGKGVCDGGGRRVEAGRKREKESRDKDGWGNAQEELKVGCKV